MSEFSIGAAMEEYDRIAYEQRELERDEHPEPDGLDFWDVGHPPSECGDPSSCRHHAEEWHTYMSGWPTVWCDTCGGPEPVVEESDEQISFEEQAREVRVTRLDCGHEIVRPSR